MNKIVGISILIFIISCSGPSLRYVNKTDLKNLKRDIQFEKSVEQYGAYYNLDYTFIENYVKNEMNYSYYAISYTIHRQLVVLNKSGFEYAKIYIPKSKTMKDLVIQILFPDQTVKFVKIEELRKVTLAEDSYQNKEEYYIYELPQIEENSVIDYSFSYQIPFARYDRDRIFLNREIPIYKKEFSIIGSRNVSFERLFHPYNGFQSQPFVERVSMGKHKYSFTGSKVLPNKKEVHSVSRYYTEPYMIYASNFEWKDIYDIYVNNDKGKYSIKGLFNKKIKTLDGYEEDKIGTIYNWFKNHVKVKYREDKRNDFTSAEVIKHGGFPHEVLMVLFYFLEFADIDAQFVFAKSYKFGPIDVDHPNYYQYSTVLIRADDKILYPYSEFYEMNEVPAFYYNTIAVAVDKNGTNIISLPDYKWSTNGYDWTADIDLTKSTQTLNSSLSFNEVYENWIHESYDDWKKEEEKNKTEINFFQDLLNVQFSDMKIKSIPSLDTLDHKFKINLEIEMPQLIQTLDSDYLMDVGSLISNKYT